MTDAGTWTGKMLGRYEIGPLIGQGGMAQVYKGHHPALKRDVAIKLIHSHLVGGEGFIERFQREAQLVAALRHPNIVQVYDLDTYDGVYFMVMEFIDGVTLSAQLEQMRAQNKLMAMEQIVELLDTLCGALEYAHNQGMIHRDVKPGNVMFTAKGQPVLTDFGLAKIVGSAMSMASGLIVGTPMYMSPEQAYGESGDSRSDIYALGVMLFELATGRAPFQGDTPLSIVFKQVNQPLPLPTQVNPRVTDPLEKIILKATAKKPEDRYQSCMELATALRGIQTAAQKPTEIFVRPPTPTPIPTSLPTPSIPQDATVRKTISLDGLQSILVRILGPVGRIMEVNRVVNAMRENPAAFPVNRLDELLDRIATQYRLTDADKKAQIRQSMNQLFGSSKE